MLICIGPDKILRCIENMIRIASNSILLIEWHCEHQTGLGVWYEGHWIRNYMDILSRFVPQNRVYITKIPKEFWPEDKNWQNLGYIIEVKV